MCPTRCCCSCLNAPRRTFSSLETLAVARPPPSRGWQLDFTIVARFCLPLLSPSYVPLTLFFHLLTDCDSPTAICHTLSFVYFSLLVYPFSPRVPTVHPQSLTHFPLPLSRPFVAYLCWYISPYLYTPFPPEFFQFTPSLPLTSLSPN